jgi:uncharacterized protein with NAD-binding domain and iron-sulfur cluster
MSAKKKVAIVGGGMAGIAAAYELMASDPNGYKITVYERHWRLGGKCASGRNLDAGMGQRIEEHGLHILMGFYENVFEILERCYEDLRQAGRLPLPGAGEPWWGGVLRGLDTVYFAEAPLGGAPDWMYWEIPLPPNTDEIGGTAQPLPSVAELAHQLYERFTAKLAERAPLFGLVDGILEGLGVASPDSFREFAANPVKRTIFIDTIKVALNIILAALGGSPPTDPARHKWFVAIYFAAANLTAIVKEVLPNEDTFRATLDDRDYKEWIAGYNFLNLPPQYLAESAPINAVYDLAFSRGQNFGFAAGQCLYDTLVMLFNYKGHIFYKMLGGMGDTIFAPLYLWLQQKGVVFKFSHDLDDVTVAPDGKSVTELKFKVTSDRADQDPLIQVDCLDHRGQPVTLPCWPNEDQGNPTQVPTTETDFDVVVLAASVGAYTAKRPGTNRKLGQNLFVDPKFQAMAHGMVTRATRAVQLWIEGDLINTLQWPPAGSGVNVSAVPALGPVLGSYKPDKFHNSWADMTQVLDRETWGPAAPGVQVPGNIAYLCDVYDDPEVDPILAKNIVKADAIDWLTNEAGQLWPAAQAPGGFPWNKLVDPSGAVGNARFNSQYWRANVDPSDHYVLGAPGTGKLRLASDGTQFTNLFLAGDWIETGLNAGCVEGAAMGGRSAARAIMAHTAVTTLGAVSACGGTPYVNRDGDLPLEHPVVMTGVTMHGLVFKATESKIQTMVNAAFTDTGVTAEALVPFVLVTGVDVQQIRSQVRPNDGFMVERELGFWIPLRITTASGTSLAWYLPYLFVDNPAAMLAGRDIFGFNKILGNFGAGVSAGPLPAQVDAQVLHTRAAATRVDWLPVANFTGNVVEKPVAWNTLAGAGAHVLAGLNLVLPSGALFSPNMPLVFLKQFRDVSNGAITCYQKATIASGSVANVQGGPLTHAGVKLNLTAHASMDIAATLGITSPDPLVGFWTKLDITIGQGWVA